MDAEQGDVHSNVLPSSSSIGLDESKELFSGSAVDLSGRRLEKLPTLRENCPHVRSINLSHNALKFIHNLSKFPGCVEVNASFNALERFSSFLPLSGILERLDVSHNVLSSCDNLVALTQLIWLNAACNHIEAIPALDRLTNLTYLDISSNRFSALPNLSRLPLLRTLNLHGNEISVLSELNRTMPQCLEHLDIGGNVITDLREAQFLSHLKSIRSVTFAENPCVRLEGRTFCYRPYLYCCCLELLQIVDDKELSEAEIIKGEELHTHAKVRRMETHAQLCAYLEKECPDDFHNSFCSDDSHLMKILKKRREYTRRLMDDTMSEESSLATISPYREWLSKSASSIQSRTCYNSYSSEQKENCAPSTDLSDLSSVPTRTTSPPTSANSNISSSTVTLSAPSITYTTPVRPRAQRKVQNRSFRVRKTPTSFVSIPVNDKVADKPNVIPSMQLQKPVVGAVIRNRQGKQKVSATSKASGRNLNIHVLSSENFGELSFVSARTTRSYSDREKEAAIQIQSWWKGVKVRRMYRLPFLERRIRRYEAIIKEKSSAVSKLENQLSNLEQDMEKIKAVNEQQASCISEIRKFMMEMAEKCDERQNYMLSKLLPVPGHLQYIRSSETEILLQWRNCQRFEEPTGYLITVDGHSCGTVRGLQKKARIADLDATKQSVIRVQCIFDEFSGIFSECLVIPPYKQELEHKDSGTEESIRMQR